MATIRLALLASVASRGWAAVVGLLAIPLYVESLGVEAYGVVGFFASVQAVIAFLDFGLPATLTRELAAKGAQARLNPEAADTFRTFEFAYLGMTVLALCAALAAAPWLAQYWINASTLAVDELSQTLLLAALALACQWPSNLYSAGLIGLQQQTPLAVSTSALAVIRVALTLSALSWQPTLAAFFWAQVAAGVLQSAATRWQLTKVMTPQHQRPVFRWSILRTSRSFAGGMTAISVTAIVLTQTDKLILSHLLPLSDFGVYAIAATLASGVYVLIGPMFSIVYPEFTRLIHSTEHESLEKTYQLSGQVMAAMVIPLTAVLAAFSTPMLTAWTGNAQISQQGSNVLVFLALGCALNGLMNIPYALQLAAGWANLSVHTNLVAIGFLVPATWWGATNHGVVGGAVAWFVLNLGYVLFTPLFVHRRLLTGAMARWYGCAVLLPIGVSMLVVGCLWQLHQPLESRAQTAVQLLAYWLVVQLATTWAMPQLRSALHSTIRTMRG